MYGLPALKDCAAAYFEHGFVRCPACGTDVDLWKNAVQFVRSMEGWEEALQALGATVTDFSEEIIGGKARTIRLTDYGVPEDAIVLAMMYTPKAGPVFPIEWHGNKTPQPLTTTINVIGISPEVSNARNQVGIRAVWVHKGSTDSWTHLTHAFEAFCTRQYSRVIVPAQSAVEICLMPIIRELLQRHASADNVKRFMEDGLTFGHAKNVLLPFFCAQAGIPPLPEAVRGSLNRLRKVRNDAVHRGLEQLAVSVEEAGEFLCAAAFGFEYVRYAGPLLLQKLK